MIENTQRIYQSKKKTDIKALNSYQNFGIYDTEVSLIKEKKIIYNF